MDLGMWEGMTEGELDEMMDAADKNGDGNGNGTIEFNGAPVFSSTLISNTSWSIKRCQ